MGLAASKPTAPSIITPTPSKFAPALRGYAKTISEATGYTNPKHLAAIEECMRHDIFHSTLDWQTRAQLQKAARLAVEVLIELGDLPAIDLVANRKALGRRQSTDEQRGTEG